MSHALHPYNPESGRKVGGRESSREVVICRALPSKVTGAPLKFRVHPLLTWPSGGGWCQGQGGGWEGKGRGMVDEIERERKIGTDMAQSLLLHIADGLAYMQIHIIIILMHTESLASFLTLWHLAFI